MPSTISFFLMNADTARAVEARVYPKAVMAMELLQQEGWNSGVARFSLPTLSHSAQASAHSLVLGVKVIVPPGDRRIEWQPPVAGAGLMATSSMFIAAASQHALEPKNHHWAFEDGQFVLLSDIDDGSGEMIAAFVKRLADDALRMGQRGAEADDPTPYEPGQKYSGPIPEIRYLPVSAIERQEMDFRPEVLVVSDQVAANMDFSQPVEVTAFRYSRDHDDTKPVVLLRDGHHRVAAAIQTQRPHLPVEVRAINAKGEKLNALIAMSREIEESVRHRAGEVPVELWGSDGPLISTRERMR